MKSRFFRRGFTLAEIMIVLMVIGIISAILLPIARHATPDENVLKFKKANATLGNVIRELVTSDKYYLDGDLGTRADGTPIDGSHDGDYTYFCETFAQMLSSSVTNCQNSKENGHLGGVDLRNGYQGFGSSQDEAMLVLDSGCKTAQENIGAEITTSDNISFFQTTPSFTFGLIYEANQKRYFGSNSEAAHPDANGFGALYKIFCIDIDGINQGEDPFGYGIRADGKILYGTRASEWINKSIQNKD